MIENPNKTAVRLWADRRTDSPFSCSGQVTRLVSAVSRTVLIKGPTPSELYCSTRPILCESGEVGILGG